MGSEKKRRRTMQKNDSQKADGKMKEGDERKPQMIRDDRFASAQSDPRFMEAPKKRSKVAIDSRFRRIFTDRGFASSNAPVDKRGKPNKSKKATTPLEHYYRLRQQEDEKETSRVEEEEELGDVDAQSDDAGNASETEIEKLNETLEEDDSSDDDDVQSLDESSSTSTADSDEEYSDEEEEDAFMLPVENVPEIEKETRRLAVVNLDWNQVRAVDLYVLLSSFLPKGGQIFSVAVYPSEFGLKRMAEESVHGPVGLFDEEESDDEGDDEIDNKKLRSYELSKLRYYFAVVECDSSATADYLYKSCDGIEFERSANKLDLRFIPDSMDFKHQPRDVAKEAPADYEGVDFQTRALQHSNVQLTWDEDEPQRAKTLRRKLNDEQLADLALKELLASDESESDDEKKADAYRALLQSGDGSDEEHEEDSGRDMEVTFNSGLEDISKRILEKKDKKSETVWEAYLKKRKEKRKASKSRSKHSSEDDSDTDTNQELEEQPDDFFDVESVSVGSKGDRVRRQKKPNSSRETTQEAEASRAELELLAADDKGPETNLKGYNLKPKKGRGMKENGIPDTGKVPTAELDDPRFSALFTSPLFALDPTDPQFKRSATYARQIALKQKMSNLENEGPTDHFKIPDESSRRKDEDMGESDGHPPRTKTNELSSLVKSIKLKSKQVSTQSHSKLRRK